MSVQILLMRDIGVKRRPPMAEVRKLFVDLGFKDARTLLQTGNVVFEAGREKGHALDAKISAALRRTFGLEIELLWRDMKDLDDIIAANPFADFAKADPSHLVVFFLCAKPSAAEKREIETPQSGPEEARVVGREVYVTYPAGIHASKFKLRTKLSATARNWNTVTKLAAAAHA